MTALPAPFKLERYFAQYEFSVRYLLCSADCKSVSIQDLLDLEAGSEERFRRLWLGYTETLGAPSLRQEIAGLYTTVRPEEVIVHAGAEEAIFLFMQAVLQPGDHIIVHWPCYQSHFEVARSIGCDVSHLGRTRRAGLDAGSRRSGPAGAARNPRDRAEFPA